MHTENSTTEVVGKADLVVAEERVGDLYDVIRAIKRLAQLLEYGSEHRIEFAIAIRHLSARAQDFINEMDVAVERVGAVLQ